MPRTLDLLPDRDLDGVPVVACLHLIAVEVRPAPDEEPQFESFDISSAMLLRTSRPFSTVLTTAWPIIW